MFGRKKRERVAAAKRADDRAARYAEVMARQMDDRRRVDEEAAERLAKLPATHFLTLCPKCESIELGRVFRNDRVLAVQSSVELSRCFGETPVVIFASPVSVLEVHCKDCGFHIGDERTADES